MNIKSMLGAAVVVACLTGCATPAQIQRQNDQLLLINASLQQIQANQMKALAMQQVQASYQVQSNALLATQAQLEEQSNALQSMRNGKPQAKAVRHE